MIQVSDKSSPAILDKHYATMDSGLHYSPDFSLARTDKTRAGKRSLNLALMRLLILALVTGITIFQLLLFFNSANFFMSFLLLVGVWIGIPYVLRKSLLLRYPISGIMILGYIISYMILPPIGQLFGFQSITHNLTHPILVEAYAFVGLLSLVGGHLIYRYGILFQKLRLFISLKFYKPIGFFRVPTVVQFWMMGGFGAVSTLFMYIGGAHVKSGILHGILNGVEPLIYVPYILLLPAIWKTDRERVNKDILSGLLFYTLLVIALSMIVNSRTFFLMGIASVGVAYGYLVLTGTIKAPQIRFRTLILIVIALFAITGPVTELAMSMVLVRGARSDISAIQLLEKTWSVYSSGHLTQEYNTLTSRLSAGQNNESYYKNIFLNRLGNLKYVDLAIDHSKNLTEAGLAYYRHILQMKVLATFPAPLLHFVGADIDKKFITSGSGGDFLLYAATENSGVIGGFRTGSLLVDLYLMWGLLWPLFFALLASLVFAFMDAFTMVTTTDSPQGRYHAVTINVLVATTLFSYMFFFTSAATGADGISKVAGFLLRGWLQIGFIYALAFWSSRFILKGTRL